MLILNAEEVRYALPMDQAIAAMKVAYAALSDGSAIVPNRTRLPVEPHQALSLFMPAYLQSPTDEALAIKVVSLFPENPAKGLAYIQAAVLVLDPQTGRTLALLEGSTLTAIRTGAGSGAAIDILARPDSAVVAIFGAGVQGRTQLEAACTARQIERVYVYNPTREKAERFAEELAGKGPIPTDIQIADTSQQAVGEADIICTATPATQPVFDDADLKPGVHISAVGAYTPSMQEVSPQTLARATLAVDSYTTIEEEAGDLVQAIRAGAIQASDIHAELGEIVLGKKPGRTTETEITCFKSVGNAIQDAVAAQLALKNAATLQLGQQVDF